MKSRYCYPIGFLLLCSCGSQQHLRQHSDTQHQSQRQYEKVDSLHIEAQHTRLYLSTEDQLVQTVLEPEGWFQITPEEGFRGKASKVIIRQVYRSATSQTDSGKLQLSKNTRVHTKENNRSKEHMKTKEKKKGSGWTLPALSLPILFLVLLLVLLQERRKR